MTSTRDHGNAADIARRRQLADFLRARRAALTPEDVGLERRGRRRVEGLRRHEVADAAAVSVTWYTWLEQARDVNVRADMLDAVCRALRMDAESWRHARLLANSPLADVDVDPTGVETTLATVLEDLEPSPAYLTTSAFDVLSWNRAACAVFGDPSLLPVGRRNGLWMFFTGSSRNLVREWELEAEQTVARFRAEAGKAPGDHRFTDIVDQLLPVSDEFAGLWAKRCVRRFACHAQTIDHPSAGAITMQLVYLQPLDRPSLVLKVHRPSDPVSRQRLAWLVAATDQAGGNNLRNGAFVPSGHDSARYAVDASQQRS